MLRSNPAHILAAIDWLNMAAVICTRESGNSNVIQLFSGCMIGAGRSGAACIWLRTRGVRSACGAGCMSLQRMCITCSHIAEIKLNF